MGDEGDWSFFGGITGPHHAAAAVAAAIDLAERAARASTTPSGSIPVGTAVHTGDAFVGATGPGTTVEDFTALGDAVNITARLASAAIVGEVIVSAAAAGWQYGSVGADERSLGRGQVLALWAVGLRHVRASRSHWWSFAITMDEGGRPRLLAPRTPGRKDKFPERTAAVDGNTGDVSTEPTRSDDSATDAYQ